MVALGGVQGWRWAWAREVREVVFALDADAAGPPPGRGLARAAVLRGKQVAGLSPAAYGGYKDASEAWAAGVLTVGSWPVAAGAGTEALPVPEDCREAWQEWVAIMVADDGVPCAAAACLVWAGLQAPREER